jgi:hypothetical protein
MTKSAKDGRDGPWNDWVRTHPDLDSVQESLSVQNRDIIVHRFSVPRKEKRRASVGQEFDQLMTVEVKTFNARADGFAQTDTFGVYDALLKLATRRKDGRRIPKEIRDTRYPGCVRKVRYLGHHVLQLSGDRPDTSDLIRWDGKVISATVLVEILRFDRDPDHPGNLLDTRRHHKRPSRETHPELRLPPPTT